MTISAQGGIFGFGLQAAKIGRTGTFSAAAVDFYKVRAPRIAVGTVQDQQVAPLEVGGTLTPTGSYKQAYFFAGQVDIIPRLEESFGILLKGTMGAASAATGKDASGTTVAGVNAHIFRFNPSSPAEQPWMAVRRMVPGASDNFGETGFDCKVTSMQFTVPAMGKIAARVQMVGRDVVYDDASAWAWENTDFEDFLNTADAGRGYFKIGGVEYPVLGATIDVANNLTTPQQEMVVGDFRPDDFIALTREAQIRIVYKYQDDALYRKLLTGTDSGTEWSSLPFVQETSGATFAFEASFQAPTNIGATSTPYELRIRANKVTWAVEGPIELQAGGIVTQTFVGTVLEPDAGEDYLQIILVNDAAAI